MRLIILVPKSPRYSQDRAQRKISLRKWDYILLRSHCSFCWNVECIFPKGPKICFCCYIAVNIGNSYGMGVGVGQLKSEGHFFLAAKENKFYSPGTAQQFLLWSIKHSQESVGVLAVMGGELVVDLVAPCNIVACNVLQSCGWGGTAVDGLMVHVQILSRGLCWALQTDAAALGLHMHSHTAAPQICPLKSTHWWQSWDSKAIYHPGLPMEGHGDFRHSHSCSHTDQKSLRTKSPHCLLKGGMESSTCAALGIKPVYGEQWELPPPLASDNR